MPFTKRPRSEIARDYGARLQIIKLLTWSCVITSAAAVDIVGYVFSGACQDRSAYVCGNVEPTLCCGFGGLQTIRSIGYGGLSIGNKVHSYVPHDGSPQCGNLHETRSSPGDYVCLGASGPNPLTGATWAPLGGQGDEFEDGVVHGDEHEPPRAPNCKGVVQPVLMRFNATAGSWYPMDHGS